MIYDEYVVVFLIAISNKKDQQNAIDTIKSLIPYYKGEIKKKICKISALSKRTECPFINIQKLWRVSPWDRINK